MVIMYTIFASKHVTSLQVLSDEDSLIEDLLGQVRRYRDPVEVVDYVSRAASVERRYRYGQAAKEILRHLAVRQCAAVDVAMAIKANPDLRATSDTIVDRATRSRWLIGELRGIARSHPLMSLNAEGDFALRLAQLAEVAAATIDWELHEGIPVIERSLNAVPVAGRFHDARWVKRHARTKPNPAGPRWYEHAPVVSRFVTIYDHFMETGEFRHSCGPE